MIRCCLNEIRLEAMKKQESENKKELLEIKIQKEKKDFIGGHEMKLKNNFPKGGTE